MSATPINARRAFKDNVKSVPALRAEWLPPQDDDESPTLVQTLDAFSAFAARVKAFGMCLNANEYANSDVRWLGQILADMSTEAQAFAKQPRPPAG